MSGTCRKSSDTSGWCAWGELHFISACFIPSSFSKQSQRHCHCPSAVLVQMGVKSGCCFEFAAVPAPRDCGHLNFPAGSRVDQNDCQR